MNAAGVLQIVLFLAVLGLLVKPLGTYMANVYEGRADIAQRALGPLERGLYRLAGIDAAEEHDWKRYALVVLAFNALGFLLLYALQRLQGLLALNPQEFAAVAPDSAFNTAVSFASNTNWQGYGGESTMSYLTQMLGLGAQNFLSAATGMAVLVALVRGFARRETQQLGNAWVDLTRSTLYILLPLSAVLAIVLIGQGVVQTFSPYVTATGLEPGATSQVLPMGPAASQVAIKQLGTNGGGFFNANSAHPFENPTPFAGFLELLSILLIPAALCYTFGRLVRDTRQGWALLATMAVVFVPLAFACYAAEVGNLEGKEVRFGIANSTLWAAATTAASNGSVNAMHGSFTPLGGLVPLWLMQLGEVVFGGAGSGLYGLLMFAIVAVFIAGLMVGRTPEYLGKKIEAREMQMASLVLLIPCLTVLVGTAVASVVPGAAAKVGNPGPHGFSEILYAFSSAGNNNGSAFGGLSVNNPFYNFALGIAMWVSRWWLMIPVLALAGSLAAKRRIAETAGTLPTHGPLFIVMLIGTVLLVGALTFVPALALGPIAEHLQGMPS